MKLALASLTFAAMMSPLAQASPLPTEVEQAAVALRDQQLQDSRAYDIVESLTVEVGPRIAGSEGDRRAVAWAEKKFHQLGFDRVYKEPVEVVHWVRGPAKAEILAPYPQRLVITALGGSVATPEGGITAPLVAFNSLDALKLADPARIKDKIVFINARMHRHRNGQDYGKTVGGRSNGAVVAAQLGAKAIVIRSVGTDHSRMPHTGAMRYKKGVTKIPAAALSTSDADLVAAMLTRNKPITLHLELDAHQRETKISYNVIGELQGREYPDEYVLLGAHLDSWDEGTGALDDGAGVGIVMAAAQGIATRQQRPRRSIRVVLYANEEGGLVGAKSYVKAHQQDMHQIVLAAESDFGAGKIWRFDTRVMADNLPLMDQIATLLEPLGIERGHNKARGGPDVSVLPAEGVAVFSLFQDGTDYFDYHHTPNDTLDKVDPQSIKQNAAAYAVVAYMVAEYRGKILALPKKERKKP